MTAGEDAMPSIGIPGSSRIAAVPRAVWGIAALSLVLLRAVWICARSGRSHAANEINNAQKRILFVSCILRFEFSFDQPEQGGGGKRDASPAEAIAITIVKGGLAELAERQEGDLGGFESGLINV